MEEKMEMMKGQILKQIEECNPGLMMMKMQILKIIEKNARKGRENGTKEIRREKEEEEGLKR